MQNLDPTSESPTRVARRRAAPPSHLPRTLILALPLALLALLWAVTYDMPTAAAATTTTYAGCNGRSPNYATIQAAVDNTAQGGVVNICPGNYNQSVNLMTMNGDMGTGDITLRKEPSVAGSVDWTSGSGDALYVDEDFVGDIVVQDVAIHNAAGNGINFAVDSFGDPVVITGSVTISNVQAFRNLAIGVYAHATEGISIFNSTADENAYVGFALMGDSGGTVTNLDTASDTASDTGIPPIYLRNLQANGNEVFGIFVAQDGAMDLLDSKANENGSLLLPFPFAAGIIIVPSDAQLPIGPLSSASGGFVDNFVDSFMAAGAAVAQGDGSSINVENTEASHNSGFGFLVASGVAPIYFTAATATDNGFDGVAAAAGEASASSISVADSTADSNGWLYLERAKAETDFTASELFGPSAGFRLIADKIAVDGASAMENQDYGFCLPPFASSITVANSRADNNAEVGIFQDLFFCDILFAGRTQASGDDVTVKGPVPGSLIISNTTTNGNAGSGIHVNTDYAAMTVANVTALNNDTGIQIDSTNAFDAAVVSQPSVQIANSLIQGNTTSGVGFAEEVFVPVGLAAAQAPVPTAVISGNVICENGAGLTLEQIAIFPAGVVEPAISLPSAIVADARGNWWGNATGPNPPGSGDDIVTGSSVVSATAWINTFIAGAIPNPTIANYPTEAAFQFADVGQTYFLQEGVGNLNEPPIFTISSDNGSITAAASISQFLHNSFLKATVTPATPGTVTINVDGPCGLDPSLTVPVATPAVSISKSPDLQGVPKGGAANFNITVKNTGNITLTAIAVADTDAPNCRRTAGVIPNLAPNAESVYSCSLTVDDSMVNEATVTAQALVNNQPSGITISDTDEAEVAIASLALTRTVWVDGYNPACQTIDKSLTKVPVGTTVKYCFTVTNTGDHTFTQHSLNDSRLAQIFGDFPHDLPPGASYSNVDAGFPATETIAVSITGVTTWTATLADPVTGNGEVSAAAVVSAVDATTTRAITLSQPGDDQDNDGVDDIVEGSGDVNDNGIPDFLDSTPTGEEEEEQPDGPNTLLLPNLAR